MATITITRLHGLLTSKLGTETAENITTYIAENIKEEVKEATSENATKDFVEKVVAESKAEMIKWMFIFWVGQLAAMFGLLYFFFKK